MIIYLAGRGSLRHAVQLVLKSKSKKIGFLITDDHAKTYVSSIEIIKQVLRGEHDEESGSSGAGQKIPPTKF